MSEKLPVKIIALQPDIQPTETILDEQSCTIGRAPQCEIVITGMQSKLVSRLHARIDVSGPRYLLQDEKSANGTYVNGRKIFEPHLLVHQDAIGLGSPAPLLRFVDDDTTSLTEHRLLYDERFRHFMLDNVKVELSPGQFRLLEHLYKHANLVCSRQTCYEAMRSVPYEPARDSNALDRAVSKLRGRLRQVAPDAGDMIELIRGRGYRLNL